MAIISEVTVRQKEGVTHTKFSLFDGKNPFPEQNFKLAQHWASRGLLDDKTTAWLGSVAMIISQKGESK